MTLRYREIPADAQWIGYRAHDFIPVWETGGNGRMIPFTLESIAELPFREELLYKDRIRHNCLLVRPAGAGAPSG